MAAGQLTPLVTVLRAEQARRTAGIAISRPAWKNLVFTGGPGTGKSRAAAAIARLYRDLGVLSYGNLIELHAADLAGATVRDTATQIREAVKVTGDLVMITGVHAWHDLPGHGQHLLRCLYQLLTLPLPTRSLAQRTPMVTKYQKFADGYKAEAVKLYRSNQTIAETARNLGLKESTLANWVKKDKDNEAVAVGEAPLTPADGRGSGNWRRTSAASTWRTRS